MKLALKKLTEKQRNTIKALYFEGYSGKEIAAKQKITPAMVSKNHKQALKILRGNMTVSPLFYIFILHQFSTGRAGCSMRKPLRVCRRRQRQIPLRVYRPV